LTALRTKQAGPAEAHLLLKSLQGKTEVGGHVSFRAQYNFLKQPFPQERHRQSGRTSFPKEGQRNAVALTAEL